MKIRSHKQDSLLIVYDADAIEHPGPQLFDRHYWAQQDGLAGEAIGRGSALFLETPFGAAVLRQYLRGGVPARFSRDRYLFTGWERSRPVAEFKILARLHEAELSVPEPLAAMTQRSLLFCSGGLLTRRIAGALPLADLMRHRTEGQSLWRDTGACIRRFHDFGVIHADLNARNILIDSQDRVFLIDFDRARICPGAAAAYARNLQRLRRSFEKLWPKAQQPALDSCWQWLMEGYQQRQPA